MDLGTITVRRGAFVFAGILLLAFAALQFNDPDPVQWMVIYGATGIALVLAGFRKTPPEMLARALGLGALCYAVWLMPGFDVDWTRNEEAYETGGMIMVGVAWYLIATKSQN